MYSKFTFARIKFYRFQGQESQNALFEKYTECVRQENRFTIFQFLDAYIFRGPSVKSAC